jgi:subfamily B ATP-binding cassette protein MsbA
VGAGGRSYNASMFRALRRPAAPAGQARQAPPTRGELTRLLAYLRPHRARMALAVVALSLGAGLGLVFPWIMQNLVDTVLAQGNQAELNRITLILIGTFLLRGLFYFVQNYTLAYVGERIVVDLRRRTYAHLHTLSLRFFADRRVGELISRLSADVTLVRTALTNDVAAVLGQGITFLGSLVLMIALNWRLTLFILALVPVLIVIATVFGRRMRRLSTGVQDQLADGAALAEEALSGVRVVKAFGREGYEAGRYTAQIERAFRVTMSLIRLRSAFGPLLTFLGFAALAGILWFGGREVLAGRLSGGALIAFLVYGINIAAALGTFTGLYTQLQEALGASRRIFDILDEQSEIRDAPGARPLPPVQGRITFDAVSFAYSAAPGDAPAPVLREITLDIQPGEALALVGPSGAGKSTLFNLIPRFYDPTAGQVCVDGHDLRALTLDSLRAQIGIVPQETQLFSGTVAENMRYGKLDSTQAELEAAAQAANAHEFIERLPQKYATLVGEKGVKLSGGQRQRIAIARAILKNPRILLLDEATSSLDSESEGLVQEALDRLMQGRTTVMIAHRLSTIHRAHRIAVLDDGALVELGAHADLLAQDGLYARLYRMQFREGGLAMLQSPAVRPDGPRGAAR